MTNRGGKVEEVTDLFSWAPKSLWMLSAAMISKDACSLEGKLTNLDSVLKSRDITLPTKVCIVKVKVKVPQSCLTLCDPMDYSVHGIF